MTATAAAATATIDAIGTVLGAISVHNTAAVQRDLVTRVLSNGTIERVAGYSWSHFLLDGSPLGILVNNPGGTPTSGWPPRSATRGFHQ